MMIKTACLQRNYELSFFRARTVLNLPFVKGHLAVFNIEKEALHAKLAESPV